MPDDAPKLHRREICRRLAYLLIVETVPPQQARERLGISEEDYFKLRQNAHYRKAATQYADRLEMNRDRFVTRMAGELDILAEQSVKRLAGILFKSANEKVVSTVSMDTLDRVGMRAPDRHETKLTVELGEATLKRLEAVLAEIDQPRVNLADWSFAMEREPVRLLPEPVTDEPQKHGRFVCAAEHAYSAECAAAEAKEEPKE